MFTLDECPPYRRVKANVYWTTGSKLREFVLILIKVVVVVVVVVLHGVLHFLPLLFLFFHQWSWIRTQPMCTLTVPTCTHPLGNTKSPRKITPEVIWIPSTMTVHQSFILVLRDLFWHSCEEGTNSKLRVTKYIEDITWPRGDTKFLFECWKYFFNTRREISYL